MTTNRYQLLTAGHFTVRLERRTVVVGTALVGVMISLAMVAVLWGDYQLSIGQAMQALVGIGDDPLAQFFVQEQRAPRIVAALLVGAALGVSGAIFQSMSRNPLGSPDIIGFMTGAATGALLEIIVFDAGTVATAFGALVGGFATSIVVYLLAYRQGLTATRLVLVGIGVGVILQSVNTLLVVRASLAAAQTAAQWLAGSFNATTWTEVVVVGAALGVLIPGALLLGRPLNAMVMGDDLAAGLGIRVERSRLWLVLAGVSLVSVATAAAGPIAFIALAAPQLARRLTRTSGVGLGSAALMGALLVLASDILAQRLFAPTQLAVGVVSGALGGIYLIWLLAREGKRGTA